MNTPLISILVCTHNRADMLKQAMETIFAQTYEAVDILVVDDGSTDGTRELIERYGKRARYYYKPQSNIAETRSLACKLALGEYIAFQDDDDLMPADRIETLLDGFQRYPEAVLAVGDWEYIEPDGRRTGRRSSFQAKAVTVDHLLLEDGYSAILWPLLTPLPHTTLFRRSDAERIGWFDHQRFFHACSDTDFFARLGRLGPIVYVPKIVSYYRTGHAHIWGETLLSEYSRFLLFEKHLPAIPEDQPELESRLRARLLNTLQLLASIQRNGSSSGDVIPSDYVQRGMALLSRSDRLSYRWYASVRLPLKRLMRGNTRMAS